MKNIACAILSVGIYYCCVLYYKETGKYDYLGALFSVAAALGVFLF